jgi:hypothetical protein
LSQLPDLPLLNIMSQLSHRDMGRLVLAGKNRRLYRIQREASRKAREIAEHAIKVLNLSKYKPRINIDGLLDHLFHLNNYESYDPTGVTIEAHPINIGRKMVWAKGTNHINHNVSSDRSEAREWWSTDPTSWSRRQGPCVIKWENGVCVHRVYRDRPGKSNTISREHITLELSSPIVNWEVVLFDEA